MSNKPGRFKSLKFFSLIRHSHFWTKLRTWNPTGEFSGNHLNIYLMWNLWPRQFIEQLKKEGLEDLTEPRFDFCWETVSTNNNEWHLKLDPSVSQNQGSHRPQYRKLYYPIYSAHWQPRGESKSDFRFRLNLQIIQNAWQVANAADKLESKLPKELDIWEPCSELNKMALHEKMEKHLTVGFDYLWHLSNQQAPGRGRGLLEKQKETWPSSNKPWKVGLIT